MFAALTVDTYAVSESHSPSSLAGQRHSNTMCKHERIALHRRLAHTVVSMRKDDDHDDPGELVFATTSTKTISCRQVRLSGRKRSGGAAAVIAYVVYVEDCSSSRGEKS
jgi:hypothetical protein